MHPERALLIINWCQVVLLRGSKKLMFQLDSFTIRTFLNNYYPTDNLINTPM